MARRGRKIPEGENREARDVQISIYVTEYERDELERVAKALGFRSKSALIAFILEPLVIDGFTGLSFLKLGRRFANLASRAVSWELDLGQFNIFRRSSIPSVDDVNTEQK